MEQKNKIEDTEYDNKTKVCNSNSIANLGEFKNLKDELKIVNGKFYFKKKLINMEKSELDDSLYNVFEESQNHVEEIWKILKNQKNSENESVYNEEILKKLVKTPQQTTIIFIIGRINTYLRLLHEELDKGVPINELGKKIDDELDVIGQLIDIIFVGSNIKRDSKSAFNSVDTVVIEFAKFGFWQIFTRNITLISSACLKKFEKEIEGEELQAEFHSFQCDALFVHEAEKSLPTYVSEWSYKEERTKLRNLMRKIIIATKQIQTVQLRAAEQQSYSFQLLQQQQAQLHAIQQQQYGGASTNWNIGIAYRPPDSIFNISAGYQQGKANIQISMVPDEQASLLGATGFTAGVGPGNLGLSLNLNI
jgi:hypothetical protein